MNHDISSDGNGGGEAVPNQRPMIEEAVNRRLDSLIDQLSALNILEINAGVEHVVEDKLGTLRASAPETMNTGYTLGKK